MDATVATGAAAMMAIRVLLDHDIPEENIFLVSLLMARSGVQTIAYAFPQVNIVTTAVDPEVNEKFHVLPGIGNFGDRKVFKRANITMKGNYEAKWPSRILCYAHLSIKRGLVTVLLTAQYLLQILRHGADADLDSDQEKRPEPALSNRSMQDERNFVYLPP